MKISFERRTCSRCFGAGHFNAYGHVYGGKCFKCHGAGDVMTKRGRTAWDAFIASMTIPASELEVGMIVYIEDVIPFSGAIKTYKRLVHSITEAKSASAVIDGVKKEIPMIEVAFGNNTEVTDTRVLSDSTKFRMAMNSKNRHLAVEAVSKLKGATITETEEVTA